MKMRLAGITTEFSNPSEIAMMKRRGWVEVNPPVAVVEKVVVTPEVQNEEAIAEINKPTKKKAPK